MRVTDNLIEQVIIPHEEKFMWRICETGAGCPVASALLGVSGASSVVYDTHVPYSKDSQEDAAYMRGVDRSVSMEFCANVIERKSANVNSNAVFVSSFQVGEGVCTHGWIGISLKGNTTYYHITLTPGIPRGAAIRRIGDIGIILMCKALGETVVEPLEIDNVLDGSGDTIWEELFDSSNNFTVVLETYGVVNERGNMVPSMRANRLEKLREASDLIIMPGSFNPVHAGHKEMMLKVGNWVRNNNNPTFSDRHDALYCITMNNFDSDKNPSAQSVRDRAMKLVSDHDVLITNSPKLRDFSKLKDRLGDVIIHVPVGWDTFMRMEDDLLSEKFDYIIWHIFDRDDVISNYRKAGIEAAKQVIRNLEVHPCVVLHEDREHMTMSSTELRGDE